MVLFFHSLASFFVRELLEPFLLILIGGVFVLAEVSLKKTKKDQSFHLSLHKTKNLFTQSTDAAKKGSNPALRLVAIVFFVFASVIAMDNLHDEISQAHLLEHTVLVVGLTFLLTLLILFLGIVLPQTIGESCSSFLVVRSLSHLAQTMTHLLNPFALGAKFSVLKTFQFLGIPLDENASTSDNEVIQMMDEGLNSGVFKPSEREMVHGVLNLDEQMTTSLMTPRASFVWLNLDDDDETNWRCIAQSGHSEFPVFQGTHDHVMGIVSVKALWANLSLAGSVRLVDVTTEPLYVPSTMTASKLIEEFRAKKYHTALVIDEFGIVEGIVTLKDVMESIMGMLHERGVKQHYPSIAQQADGSWLIDAMLPIDEAMDLLQFSISESEQEEHRYQTIGGFFLAQLGHIPNAGEFILWENFRFEVLSMNHHRIEKLVVRVINRDSGDR